MSLLFIFLIQEAVAREIGADKFVVSSSKESMQAATNSLDLILNTVSANHDVNLYLPLLVGYNNNDDPFYNNIPYSVSFQAAKGVIVQIGFALKPHPVSQVAE